VRSTESKGQGDRSSVRPQYLSDATQSITIDISGPTNYTATANLTVNSSGCTSTLASTICTLSVPGLLPGDYTATLTTYDQTGGTGNVLSSAQAVAFTITAGQSNNIDISLSGAPVSTLVVPVGVFTESNGTGGYDLIGLGAHRFVVETLDADNNIIAGPGAPTFTVGSTSGSLGVTVVAPKTTSPNEFSVTPPSSYSASTASFTVTPTFAGQQTNGCTLTGASCTGASVNVDMKQMLAVANNGTVPGNVSVYDAHERHQQSDASRSRRCRRPLCCQLGWCRGEQRARVCGRRNRADEYDLRCRRLSRGNRRRRSPSGSRNHHLRDVVLRYERRRARDRRAAV
jgi:hypothetical protein